MKAAEERDEVYFYPALYRRHFGKSKDTPGIDGRAPQRNNHGLEQSVVKCLENRN